MRLIVHAMLLTAAGLAPVSAHAAQDCSAPSEVWGGFPDLPHAGAALRNGHLTLVALGSSSTQGVGASAPDRTYPAQLEAVLRQRFPGREMHVLNMGVGGETVASNLVRLGAVIAARPDLVIWQVGTNDALNGVPPETVRRQILDGLARLRAAGIETVLMDTQPLGEPGEEAAMRRVDAAVAGAAQEAGVGLLPRHALMQSWLRSGLFTPATLLGPDRLHMTDASYRCLAERVADLLPANVTRDPGTGS